MSDKFCRDCKHRVGGDPEYYRCAMTENVRIEQAEYLVRGLRREPKLEYCTLARLDSRGCGTDGTFFEPAKVTA